MSETDKKLLRRYKAGYEVWEEMWLSFEDDTDPTKMKVARTPDGSYIGDSKSAYRLCHRRGIAPELASPEHSVCSIGYSNREQKWYGWSHRAICGFKIGYVASEGDLCTTSGWTDEYLAEHPDDLPVLVGFRVETMDDAKRVAIAFAASVS